MQYRVVADEFDFDEIPLITHSGSTEFQQSMWINMEQSTNNEDQYLVGNNRRRRSWWPTFWCPTKCGSCCKCCLFCCGRKEYKPRTIRVGHPLLGQKFPPNKVKNQKYNIITFIPIILFEQFKFFFNLYFLIMACSQFIPEFRIGYLATYWGPLGFVLGVTLLREAYDEFNRFRRDKEMNSAKYEKLTSDGTVTVSSSQIIVGDMIRVKKDQRVPADMILLRTSEKSGTCFIRTDQLDGETDWKLRIAVSSLQLLESDSDIFNSECYVFAEKPQKDIHGFLGTFRKITDDNTHEDALNVESTMWAETVVASGTALGLVVYTGKECRSAMNASQPRSKVGLLDIEVNNLAKILCAVVVGLAFVMVAMKGFSGPWYRYLFRFILLFSYIIPISLRVNLDMAKTVYARIIGWDKNIAGTMVRCSTITEELGRIGYLLSDKTGTLTMNEMVFKKLHLGSVSFTPDAFDEVTTNLASAYHGAIKSPSFSRHSTMSKIQQAVEAIALCHNVSPVYENDKPASESEEPEADQQLNQIISYQASSPDEIALVNWTEKIGLTLINRDLTTMTLRLPNGSSKTYDILQLFPFTSESKRMGIIVRDQDTGVISLYMKGADTVMRTMVQYNDWLEEECTNMAREGLRTLVVAKKVITDQQYADFEKQYQTARVAITDRAGRVKAVLARMEQDLQLICLTGVEDKLQVDVQTTLEQMANAGVKVWMLTGDKLETAVCIAKSSRLVSKTQNIHIFRSVLNRSEAHSELSALRRKIDTALIITGDSLKVCIENYEEEFAELACGCPAVVCCRCSPEQKSQIVLMLRKYLPHKRIAAVGDGGNDVGMIQAAHAGIGIVGKEGLQASLAADFSIIQFSFLSRLLLVHGRYCYKRSCAMTHYILHRGIIFSIMQAVYSWVFYFASVAVYPGILMCGYSTVYTMLPVFSLVMDRDVQESLVLTYPELYKELAKGRSLSYKTFFIWFLASVYQGAVIMYGALILFENDFIHIVSISFTALIITELVMVGLTVHIWHWTMVVSEITSVLLYVISIFVFDQYFDVEFVKSSDFWWKTIVITAVSCVPIYISKFLRKKISPPSYSKLQ